MSKYVLGIDQSTQGTKALLFDENGKLLTRSDALHAQIVNEKGWVEHDALEIYHNTLQVIKNVVEKSGIEKEELAAVGISNQRETILVWDRETGIPIYNAIVWQCSRGEEICSRHEIASHAEEIRNKTGLRLSPYFSAAKAAWVLEKVEGAAKKNKQGKLCIGTMDSWLIYKLTGGQVFATDYSNASRTQLFNIHTLTWDEEICDWFGICSENLPQVMDSDAQYGVTDFAGFLPNKIAIHAAMGDSHGALFGQGCLEAGMIKATYGTGSSIMMNIGEKPILSKQGIVTSLAWSMGGKVNYVLEGNINYSGAVITWLKDDVKLIENAQETELLAKSANEQDVTYLVPAFSGLGAPYWDSMALASISGMSRTTGKAELVKAALDSIAYQITDIIEIMKEDSGFVMREVRVDGGPTKNEYLMQRQSDMLQIPLQVSKVEELSGLGAAYAAGIGVGLYQKDALFASRESYRYAPKMESAERDKHYNGWKEAVKKVLTT